MRLFLPAPPLSFQSGQSMCISSQFKPAGYVKSLESCWWSTQEVTRDLDKKPSSQISFLVAFPANSKLRSAKRAYTHYCRLRTATCEELSWREEKERNPQITKVGKEREGGRGRQVLVWSSHEQRGNVLSSIYD